MKVNQEYVKEKLKQQMKNLASKNRNKHNNNKNKKTMKAKGEINDYVRSDFW